MPTLNSKVAITVTAPSGVKHLGGGQADSIGYFYDPADNFTINEAGLWSVDVRVWHDGQCSGGATIPPYPSGDVPGSQNGRYWFYVVPGSAPRLIVTSPVAGLSAHGRSGDADHDHGRDPGGLEQRHTRLHHRHAGLPS